MGAEHINLVDGEGSDEIAEVVESPAYVVEVNLRPDLLPYTHAEISDDWIDVRTFHFRAIGVPHVEGLLEDLVVRGGVGCVPQPRDGGVRGGCGCGKLGDQSLGKTGANALGSIEAGRIGAGCEQR